VLLGTFINLESVVSALGFDNVLRYYAAFCFEICPSLVVWLGLEKFEGFDRHVHLLIEDKDGPATKEECIDSKQRKNRQIYA